ncbi:tyrosine-type recombinase/integrase, partial [Mesorhizobium sp. ZMM04-5]
TVKQRRTHRVTLQAAAVALLRRMREEAGEKSKSVFVFPSDGRHRHSEAGHLTTIKKFAAKVFKAAGLRDVRPYDLRKAFASRLVASGADLRTVMSLTGHTQVAT